MSHPGIVNVFDFGETSEGPLYFVMEFIDGADVGRLLQISGRLAPAEALRLTSRVGAAPWTALGAAIAEASAAVGRGGDTGA